ncbi:hypothetical protein V8F20_005165 [Naviculisporaceae sp. PSN 640]
MLQTRAAQRPRQSRRSACDRCRTYKLRCERSLAGRAECERCARTPGVTCTTTPPVRPSTGTQTSHSHRQIARSFPNDRSAKTPSSCLGPISHTPPTLNHSVGNQDQEHGRPIPTYHVEGTTASNQLINFGLSTPISDICDASSMDFTLPDLNFPEDGCSPPSPSGINDFLSLNDVTLPAMTSPSAPSYSSSSPGEPPSLQEPNTMLDLLDLSSRLVEDYEAFKTIHGNEDASLVPDMPLNRLLDNTVHFSNLLKDLSLNEAPAQQPLAQPEPQRPTTYVPILPKPVGGVPLGPPSATGKPRTPSVDTHTSTTSTTSRSNTARDIVLTTTLITTYITLIRSWRQVHVTIYQILVFNQSNNNNIPLASLTSSLPTLQLGGLHVLQNNPAMQLAILLETSSSLIQGIEDLLGISGGTKSCLDMMTDPGAVSVREALLSQETLRTYNDGKVAGFGRQTWQELVAEVKNRLGSCF